MGRHAGHWAVTADKTARKRLGGNSAEGSNAKGFNAKELQGLGAIFVLAKTWGAAVEFVRGTPIGRNFKGRLVYLSRASQIRYTDNRTNSLVIKLNRTEETDANMKLINICEAKNLKIIKYSYNSY